MDEVFNHQEQLRRFRPSYKGSQGPNRFNVKNDGFAVSLLAGGYQHLARLLPDDTQAAGLSDESRRNLVKPGFAVFLSPTASDYEFVIKDERDGANPNVMFEIKEMKVGDKDVTFNDGQVVIYYEKKAEVKGFATNSTRNFTFVSPDQKNGAGEVRDGSNVIEITLQRRVRKGPPVRTKGQAWGYGAPDGEDEEGCSESRSLGAPDGEDEEGCSELRSLGARDGEDEEGCSELRSLGARDGEDEEGCSELRSLGARDGEDEEGCSELRSLGARDGEDGGDPIWRSVPVTATTATPTASLSWGNTVYGGKYVDAVRTQPLEGKWDPIGGVIKIIIQLACSQSDDEKAMDNAKYYAHEDEKIDREIERKQEKRKQLTAEVDALDSEIYALANKKRTTSQPSREFCLEL